MLLLIPAGFGTLLKSVDIVLLFMYSTRQAALPKVKAMKCVLNYLFILCYQKHGLFLLLTANIIVLKWKRTIIN